MIRRLFLACGLLGLLVAPIAPQPVSAASSASPLTSIACLGTNGLFGFQPWYSCLPKAADGSPKITKLTDIFLVLFPLVESIIKLAVLVAAGMIFFMLFKIITARGDSGKIATAIGGIRDAIIGLVIAMISVALVKFIAGGFTSS